MASIKVDDRETPEAQAKRTMDEKTLVVGPTVSDAVRHSLDIAARDRGLFTEVILTADSAHIFISADIRVDYLLHSIPYA